MSPDSTPERSGGVSGDSDSPAAADGGVRVLVIEGETADGKRFRPSDWNERLHGTLRALDDEEYLACQDFVHLATVDGRKCVQVDYRLREEDERLFNFFLRFARDNNLRTREFSLSEWEKVRAGGGS